MTRITSGLLSDTLNLVQLARETALQQGKQDQAKRLSPVVDDLRTMVNTTRQPQATTKPSGMMAQDDFMTLLAASQNQSTRMASSSQQTTTNAAPITSSSATTPVSGVNSMSSSTLQASSTQASSALERNRVIVAMAGGSMSDIDIARQMGMTREEVRLVLNVNQRTKTSSEG
jgi:hypothetical protein